MSHQKIRRSFGLTVARFLMCRCRSLILVLDNVSSRGLSISQFTSSSRTPAPRSLLVFMKEKKRAHLLQIGWLDVGDGRVSMEMKAHNKLLGIAASGL